MEPGWSNSASSGIASIRRVPAQSKKAILGTVNPETVTVKFGRPIQVVDVHGDLPDLRETKISAIRHRHSPFMRKCLAPTYDPSLPRIGPHKILGAMRSESEFQSQP